MAYDIGLRLKIDGESEFRKNLQNATSQLKTLATEMGVTTAQYAKNATSQEALTAKTGVLTKQIEAQKKVLTEQQKYLKEATQKYGENSNQALSWQRAVNQSTEALYKLEQELDDTTTELKNVKMGMGDAEESTLSFMEVLKASVVGDLLADGLRELGSALKDFAQSTIQTGMEFNSSMSQVAATMGVSVDSIGDLRDAALEMGQTTAFTATEAAEALNYMALAGYDADTSISMLPNVLNLAAAGGIELGSASDMITDSQTALGLSLEETSSLVDQMAKTASISNTSVEQLGEAILTVGGTASYMSGGTEQIVMVLGALADASIKGEEGGTKLRNLLLSLAAPTDNASKALNDLGVSLFDAEGNVRDFAEFFPELNAALSTLTDEEQLEALNTIFNSRDIAAVNALLGTSAEKWEELAAEIAEAEGAAELMAATQLDNLTGDVILFGSALDGVKVKISDALDPALREFVQAATAGLNSLVDSGTLDSVIGAFQQLFSGDASGITGLMDQMGEAVREGLSNLGTYLAENLPDLSSVALAMLSSLVSSLKENVGAIVDGAVELMDGFASGLADSIPVLIETVPGIISDLADIINDNAPKLLTAAGNLIGTIANGMIDAIPVLIQNIPQILEAIWKVFTAFQWLALGKNIIKAVGNGFKAALTFVKNQASAIGNDVITYFKGLPATFKSIGQDLMSGLVDGLVAKFEALWSNITSVATRITGIFTSTWDIHSPSKVFYSIGEYLMEGLAIGMEDSKGQVMETAEDIANEVTTRFKDLTSALDQRSSIADLQYQLWELTGGAEADEAAQYERQLAKLTEQEILQGGAVEAAQAAYEEMADQYGENSSEALDYLEILLEEQIAYEKLAQSIQEVLDKQAELAGSSVTNSYADLADTMVSGSGGTTSRVSGTGGAGDGSTQYVGTTVLTIDGREFARATQTYYREEDAANPEVVSDPL